MGYHMGHHMGYHISMQCHRHGHSTISPEVLWLHTIGLSTLHLIENPDASSPNLAEFTHILS